MKKKKSEFDKIMIGDFVVAKSGHHRFPGHVKAKLKKTKSNDESLLVDHGPKPVRSHLGDINKSHRFSLGGCYEVWGMDFIYRARMVGKDIIVQRVR